MLKEIYPSRSLLNARDSTAFPNLFPNLRLNLHYNSRARLSVTDLYRKQCYHTAYTINHIPVHLWNVHLMVLKSISISHARNKLVTVYRCQTMPTNNCVRWSFQHCGQLRKTNSSIIKFPIANHARRKPLKTDRALNYSH